MPLSKLAKEMKVTDVGGWSSTLGMDTVSVLTALSMTYLQPDGIDESDRISWLERWMDNGGQPHCIVPGPLNDLWRYDLHNQSWARPSPFLCPPSAG